eukprot:TRINITY_DN692_c0_g1_i8.p1 TRINITY_DN692_c0_g1~~TRINITY_DN692_c0_g1_i8.p1  ORF type:complete len:520 (-),score=157.26 TRINITY_DN692_c0_g1_i8:71-1630(-)
MDLKLTTFAALAAGASAFVPTGNLRAGAPAATIERAVDGRTQSYQGASSSSSTTVGLTAAAISAVGLAAAVKTQQRSSKVASRVVGISAPFFTKFDPLNLGNTDAKMERYTQVEIKHGRVAMIAVLGYIFPEWFRFPGTENFDHGLAALNSIPAEGWFQLIAFIGAHELFVKPRAGGMNSSDYGLGVELLENETDEEIERKQTVERNNGRLAMIAIFGMMWQDGTFGMTPGKMLSTEGFWGPPVDWIVKEIPVCANWGPCALKPTEGRTARNVVVYEDAHPMMPGEKEMEMSPSVPFLKFPKPLKGWTGGEKGFDPVGFSDQSPMYGLREAELKHGRVCMLATIGWLATDLGARFPGEVFQNTTTINAHLDCVKAGYMQPFLGFIGCLELYGGYLDYLGQSQKITREPGNFFVGTQFLPKDPEQAESMKLKELENGRLAMLAFSGIVTQAVACDKAGQPGFPYFADIHNVRWPAGETGLLGWQYQLPGAIKEGEEFPSFWLEYEGTFKYIAKYIGLYQN